MQTEFLRSQHKDLIKIAGDIANLLKIEQLKKDPNAVKNLLVKLSGKLMVHLAMEDNNLYPSLVGSKDIKVKAVAERFIKEMGNIKEVFRAYMKKWSDPAIIQAAASEFIIETKQILSALGKRIEKEDTELYALVDSLATSC